MDWFGVKTFYRTPIPSTESEAGECWRYEERVVLFRAKDFDDALLMAEKEAEGYATDLGDTEYLGYANAFALFEQRLRSGTEVYSLMRDSKLSAKAYFRRHCITGSEHTQNRV